MQSGVFDTIESSSEYLALLNQVVDENRATAVEELSGAIAGENHDEKQAWSLITYELGRLSSRLSLSQESLARLRILHAHLQTMAANSHGESSPIGARTQNYMR